MRDVLCIVILMISIYFINSFFPTKKSKENFEWSSRKPSMSKPTYYPIDVDRNRENQVLENISYIGAQEPSMSGSYRRPKDELYDLIHILKQSRKIGNRKTREGVVDPIPEFVTKFDFYQDHRAIFNEAGRPVTTKNLTIKKVQPMIKYLLQLINKLGNEEHKIKLLKVDNIKMKETDNQGKIYFYMECEYRKKRRKKKDWKKKVTIYVELIARKKFIDNIFEPKNLKGIDDLIASKKSLDTFEKIYIKEFKIIGVHHSKFHNYLPGNPVKKWEKSKPLDIYFEPGEYNKIILSKDLINQTLKSQKIKNQDETGFLTREYEKESFYSKK